MADTYTVTGQQEVLDVTDVSNPVRAMQVTFKTVKDGVNGTVRVPITDYTPAEVARVINAYVANIDAVHSL